MSSLQPLVDEWNNWADNNESTDTDEINIDDVHGRLEDLKKKQQINLNRADADVFWRCLAVLMPEIVTDGRSLHLLRRTQEIRIVLSRYGRMLADESLPREVLPKDLTDAQKELHNAIVCELAELPQKSSGTSRTPQESSVETPTPSNTSGTNATSPKSSGTNATSPKSSGTNATPANTSGTNATPPESSGTNPTPPKSSGTNATPPKSSGTNATPANTFGTNATPTKTYVATPTRQQSFAATPTPLKTPGATPTRQQSSDPRASSISANSNSPPGSCPCAITVPKSVGFMDNGYSPQQGLSSPRSLVRSSTGSLNWQQTVQRLYDAGYHEFTKQLKEFYQGNIRGNSTKFKRYIDSNKIKLGLDEKIVQQVDKIQRSPQPSGLVRELLTLIETWLLQRSRRSP